MADEIKRSRDDRRSGVERRGSTDMRDVETRDSQGERRSGTDSRSSDDRRSDQE